jgi:hypothetical protein
LKAAWFQHLNLKCDVRFSKLLLLSNSQLVPLRRELPRLDPRTAVLLFPEDGASTVAEVFAAANKISTGTGGDGSDGTGGDGTGTAAGSSKENESPPSESESAPASSPPSSSSGGLSAVVIIDSKWHGAQLIAATANLAHLPRVKLASYRTAFWRFHPQPKSQDKRDVRDK